MLSVNPTQYNDINNVITSLSLGLSQILKENLVGIYLFGSLSYGDFDAKSSDIDLMTILKIPASTAEIEQLKILHQQIEKQYPKWSKRLENSYTPQRMLLSNVPPGSRPYYGEAVFHPKAEYGNEWIINLYLLYQYGVTILGPKFSKLVPTVKIQDVQTACIKDLFQEWEPKLREPEWLDNPHYQSYLIMNLCRILNTVVNATALSKKRSADWVKQKFPEWKKLIEVAENWHYGLEMKQEEKTLEFLKFIIKKINSYNIN